MKIFFYLFPALLLIFGLASFSGCEKPTLNSPLYNTTWATLSYGIGDENAVCDVETQYHFFDGDSVFNNNRYAKLYCYKDEQHSTRFYEGLIRVVNSKIFFIQKDASEEDILYDFSVIEGQYAFLYPEGALLVKQVDYINTNGKNVKHIQLSYRDFPCGVIDTWYEGIGSVNGFLYPKFMKKVNTLLCCSKNDTFVYQNPKFTNCYYDKAEDIDISNNLKGTTWKLAGVYDVQSGTLNSLELSNDVECYTLAFYNDTTAITIATSTLVWIHNIFKEDKSICRKFEGEMNNDGYLYLDMLYNSNGYNCSGSELKIFFGEENNYLLYYYSDYLNFLFL